MFDYFIFLCCNTNQAHFDKQNHSHPDANGNQAIKPWQPNSKNSGDGIVLNVLFEHDTNSLTVILCARS